jgi:tetratricopeptide (TPR) repeat protein
MIQDSPTDPVAVVQAQSSQSDSLSRARLIKLVLSLALVLLVLFVYWPCCRFPFIHYDDPRDIFENASIQTGLKGENIRWAFTSGLGGHWHPLTWLSWQLDAELYGVMNAGAFHRTNMLLHAASTVVLFMVLCGMTGSTWRSAIVAALFALHPLNVESVAWATERKNTLSALFWMLTLAAYLGYVRRPGIGRYLLVFAAFALALMSKAAVVTLPCVLFLLDYWPLQRWRRDPQAATPLALPASTPRFLVLEKLPLFALVLAGCIAAYVAAARNSVVQPLDKFPLHVLALNALQSYVIYGIKMLWPMHLTAYYPHPGKAVSLAAGLASAVLLAALTLLVLGPGRRRPYLAVGWLWYLGTLVPVIGLVQVSDQALADRYAYIPMIGLFIMLAWGGVDLAEKLQLSISFRAGVVAVVVILCTVMSRTQLAYWSNDKALWEHALAVTSKNAFAHLQLGMAYFRERQFALTEKEIRAAVEIDPETPRLQYTYGTILQRNGRFEEALKAFRKASSGDIPDPAYRATIANATANVLRGLGRNEEALSEYRTAVAISPNSSLGHYNFANMLADLGRYREAQGEYRQAIELDPSSDSPHIGLGRVFVELGQPEDACAEFRRAIELRPENAVAHSSLAQSLRAEGRLEEASNEYRKARDLGLEQAASQLQSCEQLIKLRPRIPGLLAGKDQPADNGERLGFAEICVQPSVGCYALAVDLYAKAFREDPALADELRTGMRTAAAIVAARAGCGQGKDTAALTEEAKAQLRRQALDWLQADLDDWRKWAGRPQARVFLVRALRHLLRNDGLAGVREPTALARLPESEREAWQKLWQETEALLSRSHGL